MNFNEEKMKKIASFTVNHDKLQKGMYISRIDGDIVTYDVRMKKPNGGDYLQNAAMHTFEHLFATFVRNTNYSDGIIYVGPMGCRTGFYFIVRDEILHKEAIKLMQDTFEFIKNFEGQIPGTNRIECGNYLEHDLSGAKEIAKDMAEVLKDWTEEKMVYEQ
jgi:S-ribosylhomocysteine lyase